jgi:hypothetical protein
MLDALRHFVDSFEGLGKSAPKESLGIQAGWLRAALPSRPPLFGRYAPSSLRATRQRLSSSEEIYRKYVALTHLCGFVFINDNCSGYAVEMKRADALTES